MTIKNLIDGQLKDPVNKTWLDNFEPATGTVYSQIPRSGSPDVAAAVEAAEQAFPEWSMTTIEERHDHLRRISDLITANHQKLAAAESRDNGKPLWLAQQVDIPRAALNFKFFASAAMQFASESHVMRGSAINYTLRQPLGVVGCISPWNLPLYLFTWKIAPALATGNTVVAKPSEITPMTAYLLSEISIEAGLPPGVLNIVHGLGPEAGEPIIDHHLVKAISFTGGTATGKRIAERAAPNFKKLSLELGGKNPNIIFADCDFRDMLYNTVRSSFGNQGQICLCGSRIFIQRDIYDDFRKHFVEIVKTLRVGPPDHPESKQGALVSEQHMQKVLAYIELAKEEGGRILVGGKRVQPKGDYASGWYVEPTVIEGLGPECRTNQEEIFGPVVTITPFDSEEEALALANTVPYGLSATIWTQNLDRAHRMAERIQAGVVWINCWLLRDLRTPFGGMKQSGMGREGGMEAMRFFTEPKNVCVKYG